MRNLFVVPRHFFTSSIIVTRPALKPTAPRAVWVGCRILLEAIPPSGRIALVRNGVPEPAPEVLKAWRQTEFLDHVRRPDAKTWLTAVMTRIERLGRPDFTLEDVNAFEDEL